MPSPGSAFTRPQQLIPCSSGWTSKRMHFYFHPPPGLLFEKFLRKEENNWVLLLKKRHLRSRKSFYNGLMQENIHPPHVQNRFLLPTGKDWESYWGLWIRLQRRLRSISYIFYRYHRDKDHFSQLWVLLSPPEWQFEELPIPAVQQRDRPDRP